MAAVPLSPDKFVDPHRTARGEPRASVGLERLDTLWFNTGTRCNLACGHCYIDSSPTNDRLAYLTVDDVQPYLDEIRDRALGTREIAFTGGEPFLNPHMVPLLACALARGFDVLVLTNGMRPVQRREDALAALVAQHPGRLSMRVSLDHFTAARHEAERGPRSFEPALRGLQRLHALGVSVSVAGRLAFGDDEASMRAGYAGLFAAHGLPIAADDPASLVLFPEMDEAEDVPEITTACWGILGKTPSDVMCSRSRMVVRGRDKDRPEVLACTLIADDPAFSLGTTLADADRAVALNHPHCARFCVLGGAACSV